MKPNWVERTALFLWSLYIPCSAFYIFPSGMPQPADFLLVSLFALVLCGRAAVPKHMIPLITLYALFVAYTVAVNFSWSILIGENRLLIYPMYYLFNLLGMIAAAVLFQWYGPRFVKVTTWAVVASLLIQVGLSFITSSSRARSTLYFNNPNQLGYYILLLTSIYTAVAQSPFRTWPASSAVWSLGVYSAAIKLAVLSLSRAAMGATGIAVVLAIFSRGRFAVVATFVAMILAIVGVESEMADSVLHRFESRQKAATDEMEYRGYERIQRFPQYLVFGAGEGAYRRFGTHVHNEIHSLFGNLLFSYGAVGFGLVTGVFLCLWRAVGLRPLLLLMPPMAYSVVHNGIRQFELWLLVVLIAGIFHRYGRAGANRNFSHSLQRPDQGSGHVPNHRLAQPQPQLQLRSQATMP